MSGRTNRLIGAWLVGTACQACAAVPTGPSGPAVDVPAVDPRAPENQPIVLTLRVENEAGAPLAEIAVGLRGPYDTRPRSTGKTDAQGRAELVLEEPGILFVTVGESARAVVTYGSSATNDTVAVFVDRSTKLRVVQGPSRSSVVTADSDALERWPVALSNERIAGYFPEIQKAASDEKALTTLVDKQWSEIQSEADARLRKLLTLHYATYVSQAVGPQRFADLLDLVDPSDRAWVVQSAYVVELLWVMGDDAWRERLLSGLREHHDDPGLNSALWSWELKNAAGKGDAARVHAIYDALNEPRYAPTIGWRDARKHNPDRPISVGRTLPAFSVRRTDEDAMPFSETDLAGKAWVVQVWSTWCEPCTDELKALPVLYEKMTAHRDRLGFLSISVDDDRAVTLRTLSSHNVTWPSTWAPDGETLMKAWGFSGVPLTLLVDEHSEVVKIWERAASMKSIERAAIKLLSSD